MGVLVVLFWPGAGRMSFSDGAFCTETGDEKGARHGLVHHLTCAQGRWTMLRCVGGILFVAAILSVELSRARDDGVRQESVQVHLISSLPLSFQGEINTGRDMLNDD